MPNALADLIYLRDASHPSDVWLYDICAAALQKLPVSVPTEQQL